MWEKVKAAFFSDAFVRVIRTAVPAAVGVAASLGFDIDAAWLTGAIIVGWNVLGNFLETKVDSVFGWLLGMSKAFAELKRDVL